MTEKIRLLLETLKNKEHHKLRIDKEIDISEILEKAPFMTQSVLGMVETLGAESPVLIEHDDIGFYRTLKKIPLFPHIPGTWDLGNIIPNYMRIIETGFDAVTGDIRARLTKADSAQTEFYEAALLAIDAVLEYADRYAAYAKHKNPRLYHALQQIPHHRATSFYEACVFLKLLIFTIRCSGVCLLPLGHFDRYMYPYFETDRQKGVTNEELFETLENFFLSINFDTDLYFGIQQGDNGQSMVLGGRTLDGGYEFNDLARMCLEASLELNLIDPKINLRVCKDTPYELYQRGTELTKKGLGFPQYCNDDIVIPGLVNIGYDFEDTVEYSVAACWEFIIPNCSVDIPNIATLNFPQIVDQVCRTKLADCTTFDEFMKHVKTEIAQESERIVIRTASYGIMPSAYFSLFVDGCIEKGMDLSENPAKYNSSGCHGAGIANAADSLAAIKKLVFDEKYVDCNTLIAALNCNFEGYEELQNRMLDCPKMGNNDDYVDNLACQLMESYSRSLQGRPNSRGGIFRAGTGSAQNYILSARQVGATPDGRKAYEPYSSSFSPSLTARTNGPLSVIQSFTKYDLKKLINGGPLTIEIHDTTFRNEMGVQKVAQLVKTFIDLGGHQLQLNAINRNRLIDAKQHPENHRNLIVRVWGWSGYFVELDTEYQDHIIRRTEFTV